MCLVSHWEGMVWIFVGGHEKFWVFHDSFVVICGFLLEVKSVVSDFVRASDGAAH